MYKVFKLALLFCPIYFVANYTFNGSLGLTSVSSGTILSCTSSFFTLMFGAILRTEEFTTGKLISIIICIGGVILVSYRDDSKGTNPIIGDTLSIASAITYGVYTTYIRKQFPNEQVVSMPMFFGFVGIICLVSGIPIIVIYHYTKVEVFVFPSKALWINLLINAFFGSVLSDVLWSLVIFFTTPLVATMGLSFTIPLALISDFYFQSKKFDYIYLIGSALVVLGFIIVNLTNSEREILLIQKIKSKLYSS